MYSKHTEYTAKHLKELSRVKLGRLTREHISKNIPSLPKFMNMYFVMSSNAFRDRTCKHDRRTKENPMKTVREGSIILCFERPTSRKSAKSNRKTKSRV